MAGCEMLGEDSSRSTRSWIRASEDNRFSSPRSAIACIKSFSRLSIEAEPKFFPDPPGGVNKFLGMRFCNPSTETAPTRTSAKAKKALNLGLDLLWEIIMKSYGLGKDIISAAGVSEAMTEKIVYSQDGKRDSRFLFYHKKGSNCGHSYSYVS